ncbi:MAG: cell surface protein [Myxococcaceae bacterium]|jgi:hypothetical protein|nr:cell surface protein [Myxococcaceae bacterium]MCA3015508.1 cell surface protein [Myxococcaceae bacterium]
MSQWGVHLVVGVALLVSACGASPTAPRDGALPAPAPGIDEPLDAGHGDAGWADAGSSDAGDGGDASVPDGGEPRPVDPYADRVVRARLGDGSGFGQDRFPDVVLGPPSGGGLSSGSLDVLSLGRDGVIDLEFTDVVAVDGPGTDLLVFENPFGTFFETGVVSVSDDGVDWREFPCAASDADGGFPGCAGTRYVFANPSMGVSATDPLAAGGDGFDLAQVGLTRARFVRVRDSGANRFYAAPGGGFDLDAIAVVHGRLIDGGLP